MEGAQATLSLSMVSAPDVGPQGSLPVSNGCGAHTPELRGIDSTGPLLESWRFCRSLAGQTRTIRGAALSWRAGWAPLGQRVTLPRSLWHLCEATCRPGLDSGPRGRAPQSPQTGTQGALPGIPHSRLRGHFSSCFQDGSDGGGGGCRRGGAPTGARPPAPRLLREKQKHIVVGVVPLSLIHKTCEALPARVIAHIPEGLVPGRTGPRAGRFLGRSQHWEGKWEMVGPEPPQRHPEDEDSGGSVHAGSRQAYRRGGSTGHTSHEGVTRQDSGYSGF